jgi:microsomal dipeptidase-like Zn-dependent dipeptidase
MSPLLLLLATLAHSEDARFAAPVTGYADLHVHLAAHLTVPVYGSGPDRPVPADPSYRHALHPQIFADALAQSDVTLYVSLAYANPFATVFETRASMRARIERQLAFVEAFCAEHADRFTLARTPAEARAAIAAGRTVIVHGIEGMTKLMAGPEDAAAWAKRGVAVVTPIHLADNELGGSLCMPGSLAFLNLQGCWRQALAPRHRGLTPKGQAWVGALADAGIVIDLAHASPAAFDELLAIEKARGVAPVYTHVKVQAVRDDPTALTDAQVRAIYALGGLAAVTANLHDITPIPPLAEPPADYCPRSVDDLRLQYDALVRLADGAPVAWGSDFQGGIDHLRPKYGPKGCFTARADGTPLDTFDTEGLAHVGLVRPMFEHLAQDGMDRGPLDASAERFLEIWERARGER